MSILFFALVSSSPPIDYFLLSSQQNEPSVGNKLPSIESIYELDSTEAKQDGRKTQLANKTLALIRNSSHTHDNNQVDLETTRFAWHLMEKQSLKYMSNRVDQIKPILDDLLRESNVSSECSGAIDDWLTMWDVDVIETWFCVSFEEFWKIVMGLSQVKIGLRDQVIDAIKCRRDKNSAANLFAFRRSF